MPPKRTDHDARPMQEARGAVVDGGSRPGERRRSTPATLRQLGRQVHACTACSLHAERTTPVIGSGPVTARLVVVGFVPRRHEDLQGLAFAGGTRNVLETAMSAVGLDPTEVRFTSVVRCRPPADRVPTVEEARRCSSHLRTELGLVSPEVIVTCGPEATSVVLGRPVPFARVAGYRLDVFHGTTLVPTYDPATAVRAGGDAAALRRHLAVAKAVLDGRLGTGADVRADLRSRVSVDR